MELLNQLPITDFDKQLIENRYVMAVTHIESDYRLTIILFNLFSNIITISGVLITALTSLEKVFDVGSYTKNALFWTVWSLSIALTLCSKWMYSFNINKKYVLNRSIRERLYSEGWAFLAGNGRYDSPDHSIRVRVFCNKIECIIIKSIKGKTKVGGGNTAISTEILLDEVPKTMPLLAGTEKKVETTYSPLIDDNLADTTLDTVTTLDLLEK
jgi:hypothetical protein